MSKLITRDFVDLFLCFPFSFSSLTIPPNHCKNIKMAQNLQKRPFPFSFFHCHLFSPFFCCVTDDFNYLLTPCTQQIHMINCPGGRYSHHLDGAKESKELFYAVILKTATTAGGGIAGVPRENKKLAQFRCG